MQYTWDVFSTAQNSFWTHLILMPFSAKPVWGLFSSGETKLSLWGSDQVNRAVGAQGSCCFWSKPDECSVWCKQVGALVNHPAWNGQMCWKSLQKKKNSLKLTVASHNNASWYADTDGFLEHSPSGGSLYNKGPTLQKINLFWGVPPSKGFLYPYLACLEN